jgi:ABC-type sugar transport system ATPase subunit
VTENLSAPALRSVTPRGLLGRRRGAARARELAQFFQIDQSRLRHRAERLSNPGGNQRRSRSGSGSGCGRACSSSRPTQGVDGARAEIYAHLRTLADQGLAVVFASSDLPELLGLADTVATFYRGRLVRTAPAGIPGPARTSGVFQSGS